ncbi:MAG: nicotinamide-nucleotide amidohydrolase family protein [Myxococcota bacterium]
MNAEIITIGDELLRGEIVDSNKARIAERLLLLDLDCRYQVSVLDDPDDMRDAFLRAAGRSDFVLVSGGLGPTRDDLTTEVLAQTWNLKLELDAPSLEAIEAFFARVGREMADVNRKQAYFPAGADVLANPIGTAPGFSLRVGKAAFFAMPGVPRELDLMMDEQVLPRIERILTGAEESADAAQTSESLQAPSGEARPVSPRRVVRAALLRTFGMGESTLEAELLDFARDGSVELGYRTSFPDNFLRPVARAATAEEADARIDEAKRAIVERLGPIVYGEGADTMESVVGRMLTERKKTVATAESCTGGLIAERITDVPGSSAYFLGGIVSYANSAKSSILGVSDDVLESEGAVSEPVVRAMAEAARERFGSDFAVATSGISGPGGGTETKPVGLVWIALATAEGTHADSFVFQVDRTRHRSLTAQVALDWIRRSMLGAELIGPSLMRRSGGGSTPNSNAKKD